MLQDSNREIPSRLGGRNQLPELLLRQNTGFVRVQLFEQALRLAAFALHRSLHAPPNLLPQLLRLGRNRIRGRRRRIGRSLTHVSTTEQRDRTRSPSGRR